MKLSATFLAVFCPVRLTRLRAKQSRGGREPAACGSSTSRSSDTSGMAPNKSGSGTSTSGGSDANGDRGRDTMPNGVANP